MKLQHNAMRSRRSKEETSATTLIEGFQAQYFFVAVQPRNYESEKQIDLKALDEKVKPASQSDY